MIYRIYYTIKFRFCIAPFADFLGILEQKRPIPARGMGWGDLGGGFYILDEGIIAVANERNLHGSSVVQFEQPVGFLLMLVYRMIIRNLMHLLKEYVLTVFDLTANGAEQDGEPEENDED